MISMKVQKAKNRQAGSSVRSLILVTVCTSTAIAFAAGGRIADYNGKMKYMQLPGMKRKLFLPGLMRQMYCLQVLQV